MKRLWVLLIALGFAGNSLAQMAPGQASAGGASGGASLPTAFAGPASTITAVVGVAAAAAVAATTSRSTVTTASHH